MNAKETDNIIKNLGLDFKLEPYNYEAYKKVNPKLTEKMYGFLRGNGTLWKVLCGKRVEMKYENEVLDRVWWLDTEKNFRMRYCLSV